MSTWCFCYRRNITKVNKMINRIVDSLDKNYLKFTNSYIYWYFLRNNLAKFKNLQNRKLICFKNIRYLKNLPIYVVFDLINHHSEFKEGFKALIIRRYQNPNCWKKNYSKNFSCIHTFSVYVKIPPPLSTRLLFFLKWSLLGLFFFHIIEIKGLGR